MRYEWVYERIREYYEDQHEYRFARKLEKIALSLPGYGEQRGIATQPRTLCDTATHPGDTNGGNAGPVRGVLHCGRALARCGAGNNAKGEENRQECITLDFSKRLFEQNKIKDEAGFGQGLQAAWEAVNMWIQPGELPGGNGTCQNAQRNGMILASNVISDLISAHTTGPWPNIDMSKIGEKFKQRPSRCRVWWLEATMKQHYGPDWWQQPHEDIDVCRYIAKHFPMMVDGCVVPAYARVRDLGFKGNLNGAL